VTDSIAPSPDTGSVREAVDVAERRASSIRVPAGGAVVGSIAASFISQGALVVTGVVVARTLGPTDRGYLALLFLVPAILLQVGTLGLPMATTYFLASNSTREARIRRNLRGPVMAQIVVLTLVQAGALWLLTHDEPHSVRIAAIVSLGILTGAVADMYAKAILQGQGRYAAFNVLWNALSVFYLVGIVGLVATGHADLVTIATAWVAANLASGALTSATALSRRPRHMQTESDISRRQMLRFGLKGFLGSVSPVATFRVDQAMIGLFLAPEELGLYVAGLAFTTLPTFISRGISMIALPQVARSGQESRSRNAWRYLFLSTVLTGLVIVVLELLAGVLVPFFFGADFDDAVSIARILLLGTFFWGVRRVLSDATSGSGRPGLGSMAELVSWVVVVPALAILMPLWGVDGVAAAMAVSSAASLLALVFLLLRSDRKIRKLGFQTGTARLAEPID